MNRSLLILLVIFISAGRCVVVAKEHPRIHLGAIPVDNWKADVSLQDNTNSVSVLVRVVKDRSKRIASGRFDAWVLAGEGRSLNPLPRNIKAIAPEISMGPGKNSDGT